MDRYPLYRLEGVKKSYGKDFTLEIRNLEINRGDSIGLYGPNGSGKSTLLRILAFLEKPDSGKIYFENRQYPGKPDAAGSGIVLQLQDPYLLKRSVYENIAYGLKRKRLSRSEVKNGVRETMQLVGLDPEKFANRYWFQLSGGEAVRVALAARLALKPSVLIMDEPMSNIDSESSAMIRKAIMEIHREQGTTLVMTSHDLIWLNTVSDNILRIHNGRIAGSGMDNVISGPWVPDIDGLWSRTLGGGLKIYSGKPPSADSTAIIEPSEIIVSTDEQQGISARNRVKGRIQSLVSSGDNGGILADIDINGISMNCSLTINSVHELRLVPGMEVWVLFKASSLRWQ